MAHLLDTPITCWIWSLRQLLRSSKLVTCIVSPDMSTLTWPVWMVFKGVLSWQLFKVLATNEVDLHGVTEHSSGPLHSILINI